MVLLLRRFLPGGLPALLAFAALTGVLLFIPFGTAKACWNTVLTECFDENPPARCENPSQWPWQSPPSSGRLWRHWMNPPYSASRMAWGFHQGDIYDTHLCQDDQSLWCVGCPQANDPEFNSYMRSLDTYLTYGPINLSLAEEAFVSFYLYNNSESAHDSVFWGAATTFDLASAATMNVGGRHYGFMEDWQPVILNLDSLVNLGNGADTSMIGQAQVWVFWRFRSDANTTVDRGAFLDNVQIAWDDGGVNLMAHAAVVYRPDTVQAIQPQLEDTLFASFSYSTCNGGVGIYPEFHITGYAWSANDTTVIIDTLITEASAGRTYEMYTNSWIVSDTGLMFVRIVIDTLNEVAETIETDNAAQTTRYVPPPNMMPEFYWIQPGSDTLIADSSATIIWQCYDPEEQALLTFYTDPDNEGCIGVQLPGGARLEDDREDSLIWVTRSLPDDRIFWPYVKIQDAAHDTCVYAPYPIRIQHGNAINDPGGILPREFYLEQNHPNPFNPTTQIRYGVAKAGNVTITVYDVLGQEVATLVDEQHRPGSYIANFDGSAFATGVYVYTLTSPEGTISHKMMLLK